MSNDDTPLNDGDSQPKSKYMLPVKERPLPVMLLLGALFFWNLFWIFGILSSADYLKENVGAGEQELINFFLFLQVGLSLLAILGIGGIWFWKKWGYNALLFTYAVAIVLSLCSIDIQSLIINCGIAFLIYMVIGKIRKLLD